MDAHSIAQLFDVQRPAIVKHISNIYKSGELDKNPTCSVLEQVAADGKLRKMNLYNLDLIVSVGYRVNSKRATRFRQWANDLIRKYLEQGYVINERRLAERQQEVLHLKNGIRIISRVIENKAMEAAHEWLGLYARGLQLLDDYDHENLDRKGNSNAPVTYPSYEDYVGLVTAMRADFSSSIFGQERDDGFKSAIEQIRQSFDGRELYPTFEEKAATLLYLIVKNHAFVDGNKRIAAACFLLFLQWNQRLQYGPETQAVSNEALASLTLFVAASKSDEMETVKRLIISILNRNQEA